MLEVEGLSVGYPAPAMVRELELRVEPGEAVCLIGPNGAGKTTALRGIMGLANRLAGAVRADGRAGATPAALSDAGVAYVPEGRHVFPQLTVEQNLLVAALALKRTRPRADARLRAVYERFPLLETFGARPAGALSGGQQQILAIGRALMQEPRYLLIDEPSLGLSPIAVDDVADAIGGLVAQGVGVLLVEQDVELSLGVCSRGYVLVSGRVLAEGTANALEGMNVVQHLYFGAV